MATQVICDLCGEPIININELQCYKIKKLRWVWYEHTWESIDAHKDCIEKLFNIAKQQNTLSGESSMQNN